MAVDHDWRNSRTLTCCRRLPCLWSPVRVGWYWLPRQRSWPRRPGWPAGACWSRAVRRSRGSPESIRSPSTRRGPSPKGSPSWAIASPSGRAGEETAAALNPDEVLRLAAAAEQPSEHPLARMLVAEAQRRGLALPAVDDFQAQPGAGILAKLDRADAEPTTILVGNLRLVREHGVTVSAEVEQALDGPGPWRPDVADSGLRRSGRRCDRSARSRAIRWRTT